MAQFAIDEILTTGIAISGFVFDVSNNIGANGYVLTSTSSGVMWQQDSSNADLSSLSGQIAATGTLLNNRINSLSGYAGNTFLSGSGTQYYVPRWNTARELVTGSIYDLGTGIGIGTTSPAAKLEVKGADDAVITAIFQSFAGNPAYNGGIQLGNAVANQNSQIYHSSAGDNTLTFVSNYSQGTANKFIFAPGGTETVRFQQNGRVGIGTASPTTLLSVGGAGSTSAASGLTFGGDSVVNLYRLSDSVLKTDAAFTAASLSSSSYVYAATYLQTAGGQLYAGAPYGTLTVYVGNTAQNAWEAGLYVGRGSYVGIGTTQPSGKLHVVSTVAGETVLRADGTNGTLFSVTDDLSDSLMSVNNSAGLPVFEVFADDRVVAGQYGSGDFVLVNNKVGIGTTNPTYKLHVLGDTLISGNLTNPTIIGLSGALNITGSTLDTKINTLSGYSNANFATITNLAATGSTLDTKINTTNTNLAATGSTLDARINSLSGYANNTFLSGVGVANYVPRWNTSKQLVTGNIYDDGTNVGIGTTNPAVKLVVYDSSPTIRLQDSNTNVVGGVFGTINWLSSDSSMPGGLAAKIDVLDDSATYGDRGALRFFTNNATSLGERMRIASDGNVGIGTVSPTTLLSVGGAGSTSAASGITFGADSQANLYRISSSRIKTDGNFTIDGQGGGATSLVLNRSSTSSENGMAFYTAGSTDWYFFINDGGTDLQIQRSSEIDSAPRVRFDGANSNVLFNLGGGNVGIGTPSPNTKLRISGSFSHRPSGSSNIQEYKNIVTYNSDDYSSGAYVVRTPFQIGNSYEMPIVHVKGYGYGDAKLYDFKVVFYDYGASHSPISYSLIDLGNDGSPKYLAKDASNYINVCFGQTGDVHYYYRFTVDCITTRQENDYSQGWGMYQTKVANFGFASTGIYALSSPVNFNVANNFVGIGKTNPSAKLDVVGNIYLSADIVGNDGTRGYLLGKDSLSAGRCYLILDPDAADGVGVGSDYLYIAQENTTGVISNSAGPLLLNPGAGSVGIGTTNAVAQFHIGGTASNSNPWMVLDVNDTFFKRIVFSEERPTYGTTAYGGYIGYDATANTVSLGTYNNSSENRSINILRDNGYVGIGTTQPLNRLSVISSNSTNYYNTNAPVAVFQGVSPSTVLIAVDGNVDGYYSELKLGNAEGTYYPYSAYIRGIQGAGIDYYRMEFGTSNGSAAATRMTIANNGNIGIGVTNPSNKLHISGGGISFTTSTGLAVPMIGIVLPTNIAYIGPYATTTDGNAPSTVAFNHGTSVQQTWFYSSGRIVMVLNKEGRLNIAGNAGNTPPALLNVGPASSVDAVSGMSFGNDSSANLYRSAAGALKTDGSLGIGINPVQKLQVDGAVGNPALNGTTQSGIFRISNTTDNAVLDFGIRAGGLGAWIQSTDETSLSATYPLLLNPNGGSVGIGITNPSGQLHLRNMGFTNQDTVPDTNLFPNASGVFGLVMDHDTYTNGLYRHRFIKVDRSANIPLYLQQAGSVAHQYINLVRFGTHSQSTDTFEVFGDSRINGSVNVTSTLSTSGSINIGTDLYVSGQLGVGVPIANKRLNYGAEIKANNFSIQLVLGRIGAVSGLGAIGADANNTFAVWNVSGQTTRQFVVTQQGNVGIGSASPVSRLDVNGTIALSGYSFADRFAVYNRVWNPELPSIYLGDSSDPTNYYDNTTHIFRARGAGAERMRITTAGNVGIGSESPTQKLDVSGTLKIKSAGTYSDPTDNAGFLNYDTVGGIFTLSARSDGGNTYMAFRTSNGGTGSEKVRITNNGLVGISSNAPTDFLDFGGAGKNIVFGYAAYGEVLNSAASIIGNNVKASPTANSQVRRFANATDQGNFIKLIYNKGVTFHTNITSALNTDISEDTNERMRIDLSGNVGIGTTGPTFKLSVQGIAQARGGVYVTQATPTNTLVLDADSTSLHKIYTNSTVDLSLGTNSSTTQVYLKDGGNVGIGINNPSVKLAVNGEASFGDGSKLTLIGLDINDNTTPSFIKIRTKIPFASASADFTVNIKGFKYGTAETTNLSICWHYYNSTFYQPSISSAGSFAPIVKLSAEDWDSSGTPKVCIVLVGPGYYPKLYVESMYSSNYNDEYADGWDWVDADATGTGNNLAILAYKSNFGNNFLMLNNGYVGIGSANPTQRLDVGGYVMAGEGLYRTSTYGTNGGAWVSFGDTGVLDSLGRIGAYGALFNINSINGDTSFQYNGSEKMRITTAGNVGIGITNPSNKLQISGGGISFTTSTGLAVQMIGIVLPTNIGYIGPYNSPADGNSPTVVALNHAASVQQTWFYSSGRIAMSLNREGRFHIGNLNNAPNCLLSVGPTNSTLPDSGICFGNDAQANLYRSAEDVIKTDGSLIVTNSLGLGISPTQKLQVDGVVGNPALNGTTQSGIFRISNTTDNAVLDFGIRAGGLGAWIQSTDETSLDAYYPLLLNPNGGNVGIGTITANHKLDLNIGTISTNPTTFGYNVFGNATSNVGYCGYNLQLNNSTANATAYLRLARTSATAYLGLEIASQSRDGIRFLTHATAPVEVARITNEGNVGIGTTSPIEKLHVSGNIHVQAESNSIGGNGIYLGGATTRFLAVRQTSTNKDFAFDTYNDTESWVNRLTILNNGGNVGIGQTSPLEKLQVQGNIYATDGALFNFKAQRIPIQGNPQGGTYKGYLILAKAFTSGLVEASYVIGKVILRRGTSGTGHNLDIYEVNSSRGYNTEIFQVSRLGAIGTRFVRLVKVTYGGVVYHAIETSDSGGQPSTEMYFEGSIIDSPLILTDASFVSNVTAFGNGVIFVDQSSNIGIGTTSPDAALHVRGEQVYLYNDLNTNNTYFYARNSSAGNAGIKMKNSDGEWTIIANDRLRFIDDDAGGVERLSILSNGNVGIGTVSPTTLLSVGPVGSTLPASGLTFGGDAEANLYRSAEDTIKTDGNLIVVGNVTAANLVSGNGTANYITKWNGTKSIANSQIFDDGTYVGVNTAVNTTYRLQVNGSFAATTKSFDIVHPTISGKRLIYASLEGPENGVYFRGKNDNNEINLPHYWSGLVHDDSITVDLTSVGKRKDGKIRNYSVDQIGHNKVYIYTDSDDNIYDYYYTIFAERKDVSRLITERDME